MSNKPINDTITDEIEETNGQYVTFFLNDETFAFAMDEVKEIVRVPSSVDVPLTPNSLLGLANLRGTVLPVLDLRKLLNMEERDFTDATRVIIADCTGCAVGLVVDRVSRVISVDQESIEDAQSVKSSIQAEMLTGVVKNVGNHSLIQLLDAKQVVQSEFSTIATAAQASCATQQTHSTDSLVEDNDLDTMQLVSFLIDQQEYAFDINEVEEIVRLPDDISKVPRSEAHVLGIINLRKNLLPLVNLRTLFHLGPQSLSDHNRILVVNINDSQGHKRYSVGIVVDHVKEVLSLSRSVIDSVPTMLSNNQDMSDVTGICRLGENERLVSILSSEALFNNQDMQQILSETLSQSSDEAMMNDHEHNDLSIDDDETQLVVFQLAGQEFGISIESVQEITRIPEEMNKVPKTAEFIEGMINLRGSVLPVMDMRTRFGITHMEKSDRQRIIVLDLAGTITGFITDAVAEVLRLPTKMIESAPALSDEQEKLMGRVVNLKEKSRMIQVLDASELLDRSQLAHLAESM